MRKLKKSTAQTFYLPGVMSRFTGNLQANPTIAAADCRYSLDGGAFTAFDTTPTVAPAGGTQIAVTVTVAEVTGTWLNVRLQRTAGDEWDDYSEIIYLSTNLIDDLATAANLAIVDGIADGIKAKTDNLPADPADQSAVEAAITAAAAPLATAVALAVVDGVADDILVQVGVDGAGLTALGDARMANLDAAVSTRSTLTTVQVNAEVVDVLRIDTIPDSYAALGAQPTIAQALLAILQFLTEKDSPGTTVTVSKPDGTVAMTFTLDSATIPTSITRAT